MSTSTPLILYLLVASTRLANAHIIRRKGGGGGGGGGGGARGASVAASGGSAGSSGGSESLTHEQWSLIFAIVGSICGVILAAIVGFRVYWCIRARRRAAAVRQHFEKHARYSYVSSGRPFTTCGAAAAVGVRKPERTYIRL